MPQQHQQQQQQQLAATVVAESAAETAAAGRCGGRVMSTNTRNWVQPTLTTRPLPGCAVSNVSEGTQILVRIFRLSIT